jgi:hypothetical protein
MSDVAKRKLRGPVRTLRSEHAEWDAPREAWKPPRHSSLDEFRTDGKISASTVHNPDGTIVRTTYRYDDRGRLMEVQSGAADGPLTKNIYSYDDAGRHIRTVTVGADGTSRESESCRYDSAGRKTKVSFLQAPVRGGAMMYGLETSDFAIGSSDATSVTTTYGDGDLPEEMLLHDANHEVTRRIRITRDREGRVLSEVAEFAGQFPFPEMRKDLAAIPPEQVAALTAMLSQVFQGREIHGTTYAYDRQGRVLERTMRMGVLDENRVTYRYDDRDNPIEELSENRSREIGADPTTGALRSNNESMRRRDVRYEYQYDAEGNWTERIVSSRMEANDANANFQRSNVERRQFSYYGR